MDPLTGLIKKHREEIQKGHLKGLFKEIQKDGLELQVRDVIEAGIMIAHITAGDAGRIKKFTKTIWNGYKAHYHQDIVAYNFISDVFRSVTSESYGNILPKEVRNAFSAYI